MDNHLMRGRRAFHVMAKPIGPACNLECAYCFYLGKDALYPGRHSFRMSDEVLENFVRQYIAAQQVPEVTFAWQGGEPTLMGLDFFRRAVTLQKQHLPPGKRLINALQTNGTLLDDAWCECSVLYLCNGECPKNRFLLAPGGEEGLNYLCAGLKRFFEHTAPTMEWMAGEFQQGRPPSGIMQALRSSGVAALSRPGPPLAPHEAQPSRRQGAPGRNDPCPCRSGKKFKRCCGSG